LTVVIGPVAKILYLDYAKEIQEIADFKALNALIDKLSKQLLIPEQQTLFRQGMLSFVNQYNLKGQEATLNALKGSDRKLRLSTASLALCIAKHAAQGVLGAGLIDNLAFQLERAGNVGSAVSLFEVLRLLEKSTKTGLLEVREKEKIGGFYFDKGVLFNAVEFGMNGKLIAFDIMQWQHDYLVFRGVAQEGVSRQITQPIEVLIKELEKLRDPETAVNTPSVICSKADEVTYIADAIHLIESCDNNRAEPLLTSVLMGHEENFKGWFWFSRILTNMTAIEIALKKAAFLQPKNPELSEDIKKFTLARKNIKGDFVLRCPFCWMPNDEHDFECAYCKSNFFITPDFFKTIGKAKVEILDKAIERYGNVLQQEQGHVKNPYLRFYLAMAYLNRKYYQEGLDQLHEIAKLLPESNALLMQSRILTDYMNTEGLLRTPVMSPPIVEKTAEVKTGGALKKILIVEDSMVTRKVIARTLVANGYEVFEAKNASEALTDFENRNPNLILLDIILPGKDGYEILAEIRQKPGFEKLPVIMLTSRDSLFDKLKGKVSDANEYLTKPFQPDELLAIVRKYLK
jgi:twitching motility two-component system response regulator PilG